MEILPMKWVATSPATPWYEKVLQPTEASPQLSITHHRPQTVVACEIWAGTIERADYDAWAHTILVDPRARPFVSGVGHQWVGKGAVQRTHQSWLGLRLLQTECECGDGSNTWDYAHYVFTLLHHYLCNGVNGFVYWNMVLPAGGRSTWSWTQNSMITVDTTQQTVTYNRELYVMKHLAHFVAPGSVRRDLQGPLDARSFNTIVLDGRALRIMPKKTQGNVVPQERVL